MCHGDALRARVCRERLTGSHAAPCGASPSGTKMAPNHLSPNWHRASPFCRIRTIGGVPEAQWDILTRETRRQCTAVFWCRAHSHPASVPPFCDPDRRPNIKIGFLERNLFVQLVILSFSTAIVDIKNVLDRTDPIRWSQMRPV